MTILTFSEWQQFSAGFPQAHVLQQAAWGELKAAFGWRVIRVRVGGCGAQVLFRRFAPGLTMAYLPKGPLGDDCDALWAEVHRICRQHGAFFLKVEPDAWAEGEREWPGFVPAAAIQPRRTVVVSLRGSEADWLERMKPKTRYNIRLAERKGVTVRETEDVQTFHALMQVTGKRDGFGVHSLAYYQRAYDLFVRQGQAALLQAEFDGRPLAALMVFYVGQRAWYLYGASNDEERNRMPTYLLQWEAMRWAAARGCLEYDLWGVPDVDEAELEAGFTQHSDGLWGVYRFKRGFGGEVRRAAQAWNYIYQPLVYRLYGWYAQRMGRAV
ncbi:MAG: peptidoglycan bridge formation glycyltransferase FemA/FemB family protein [Anaerolinea sp.]|nr:peptidoglycan bridge formation glycyltransferase FemA/FemB family protein [Anaerolinea sp.]